MSRRVVLVVHVLILLLIIATIVLVSLIQQGLIPR